MVSKYGATKMLKRKIILITFLLLIFSSCVHSTLNSGPRPIAFFSKYYPFVPCDDIASMVLYEDGTFIFKEGSWKEDGCTLRYKKKKLTNIEIKALSKQLGPTKDFMSLDRLYNSSRDIDFAEYPEVHIYLSDGKNKKAVTVVYNDYKKREGFPKEIRRVYDLLHSIDRENASKYIPEYYNVILSPVTFYNSDSKTIPWPKELPGLNDQYTVSFGDGYLMIIPDAKLEKYSEELWEEDRNVLFEGEKYDISATPAFPYDDVLRDAFKY